MATRPEAKRSEAKRSCPCQRGPFVTINDQLTSLTDVADTCNSYFYICSVYTVNRTVYTPLHRTMTRAISITYNQHRLHTFHGQ